MIARWFTWRVWRPVMYLYVRGLVPNWIYQKITILAAQIEWRAGK